MCGISGYIHKGKQVRAANISLMNAAIKHRGPDDEGFVLLAEEGFRHFSGAGSDAVIKARYPLLAPNTFSSLALGFRRLSIVELSEKGHQPMSNKNVVITFNGEIYNYKSLRKELESLGCMFISDSDTEVVLQAYQVWGINCVHRLNGMFAICLVDLIKEETFLIRDRLGIKPLFYHSANDSITWCSEIKGILKAEWVKPELNMDGLILNYQFKSSVSPFTCFKNIYAVAPAQYIRINNRSLNVEKVAYWQIPTNRPSLEIGEVEAVAMLRQKLYSVVGLQMQADVPAISMMSGGVDSTLITALAHQQNPEMACYTLSIDGTGSGLDELPQSQKMAKFLGIKQYIHQISEKDVLDNALNLTGHFEEPYNNIDVVFNAAQYLNKEGYKVVLSGNGADEVFGGYPYYLQLNKWQRQQKIAPLFAGLPNFNETLKKAKFHLGKKTIGQFFMGTTAGMRPYNIASLIQNTNEKTLKALTLPFIEKSDFDSDYEGLFFYDLAYSVAAHHVYHDDICAMRFSVEMRYPYLDHELIELVAQMPLAYRFNGKTTKPLLRHVASDLINPENLSMSKKGFTLPMNKVIETNADMKHFINQQIAFLKSTGLFNAKTIDTIVAAGKRDHYYVYTWQLVSTAVWLQRYF